MKKVESILLYGCAYSVAIMALFFAFASISGFSEVKLGVSQYFLILLFGQLISVAGFILKNASWHIFVRYALHYLTLFLAFCVIFIVNGNIKASGGGAILSAGVIFTFFYAVILLLVFLAKKSINGIDKNISKDIFFKIQKLLFLFAI